MTTINSIQDLIQLLRDQPQWADELRGILFSDEIKDLPAAVRDLAQAVRDSAEHTGQRLAALESLTEQLPDRTQAVETKVDGLQTQVNALETKGDGLDTKVDALDAKVESLQTQVHSLDIKVDAIDTKVDGLQTQVDGLQTQVDGLQTQVNVLDTKTDTLTGQMNHLRGAEYERRAENRALHRTQTQMGFLQPRTIMGPRSGLQPVFSSALARARASAAREQPELTEQNNFLNADIIIADMGNPDTRERRSPPVAYALFEASITADSDDVQRAAARARTLGQTMGVPAIAAVIADNASELVLQEAHGAEVQMFLTPDR